MKDKSKLTRKELIILLISAVVTITIVSTCSPLYPFNPWDDANCFLTLGRGIKHGMVPYRDLYEQKGPLLYFIYFISALISEKSFVGAWIFECIAASFYAVFSWKTVKLFVTPSKYSIYIMPLFLGVVYTVRMFNFGGNAEELCFPLLTAALFIALRSIVINNDLPSKKDAVLCGIITAALFWIKYTFVGFMAGLILVILCVAIKRKEFARLWSLVWRFLAGFAIITLPIAIYFLVNNSLTYLWDAYFYNNIFLYQEVSNVKGLASVPVVKCIYIPVAATCSNLKGFPSFAAMMLLSFISVFTVNKKYLKRNAVVFFITFFTSICLVFTKVAFIYYYGYILAYCFSVGLIGPVILLNKGFDFLEKRSKLIQVSLTAALIVFYCFSLIECKNIYLMFKPKEFVTQYKIAETIKQTPDAKILTYDVMDAGFYTVSDILPCNRFYCFLNIESNYPAILEEQDRLIEEGYYDYIVTSYFYESEWDNYELIQTETGEFVDFTGERALDGYKLYKKI